MSKTATPARKEDYSALVDRVANGKERVKLTRDGKEVAAMIPIEDLELFEQLEDYVDLLESLEAFEEIEKTGRLIPWEKLKAELDSSAR